MKKILLALASILIVATTVFAVTDYLIKSPSGNLIIDAATGYVVKINKTLQVDNIKNLAGTSSPPGMVPIGGMVTVMPNIQATDAWQPPATGVIKDGFMRADGHIITAQNVADGSMLRVNTTLPDMRNKYARGNTTSGGTGGANTVTLAANQIPQLSGAFTSGVNSVGHTHTITTGGISANHTHSGSTGNDSPDHSHNIWKKGQYEGIDTNPNYPLGAGPNYSQGTISTHGASARHAHPFTTGTVSADHTHSGTTSGVSANHTHNTTVTLGSASPSSVNNEPAYVEVVWVIRVK